jgi:arginine decarboxylase
LPISKNEILEGLK